MGKVFLQIDDLEYAYPGTEKTIFKDFTAQVKEGEVLGLIGKNGVGKSTLLRLMASIYQPVNGSIRINDIDSDDFKSRKDYLTHLNLLTLDKNLPTDSTVEEYLKNYSELYSKYDKKIEEELLSAFGLTNDQLIFSLSNCDRLKLFFLFSLASKVPLILIDELSTVVDQKNRALIFEQIKKFKSRGVTFILATNLVEELEPLADRVWYITDGSVKDAPATNLRKMV